MAIWQGLLPNFIPPESAGMTGFRQESVGQGKELYLTANAFIFLVQMRYGESLTYCTVLQKKKKKKG
jgi:hypothetical protein